ncbi:MAG: DUF1844 domain-containing protein [Bacillota bacterium]
MSEEETTRETGDTSNRLNLTPLNMAMITIGMFINQAWTYMGLVMEGQEMKKDLAQAKLAIDCASELFRLASPFMGEEERRRLRATLADVKINFANQSKDGSSI